MSLFAALLRAVYRASGAKKAFALPKDQILSVIERQNRTRGVFTPTDHKAFYEMLDVGGYPCLVVRQNPRPAHPFLRSAGICRTVRFRSSSSPSKMTAPSAKPTRSKDRGPTGARSTSSEAGPITMA